MLIYNLINNSTKKKWKKIIVKKMIDNFQLAS